MPPNERIPINISFRVNIAIGVLGVAFFLILFRLWYLQILKGDYFRFRSENNLLRTVFIPPPRGMVIDRNGEVLVKNRAAFDVDLVTEDAPDPKGTITELASILDLNPEELLSRLNEQRKRRRFEPKLILRDVSRDVVAKVAANRYRLPGIEVNVTPAREYVFGDVAAHILGYIREITKDQLEGKDFIGYLMGDLVGQFGLESKWEEFLRGERGIRAVIVNAGGTRIREHSYRPAIIGHNVMLTIDARVQRVADAALAGKKGAIVALDPKTGEILALSSSPRFDPNMFTGEITPDIWKDLTTGVQRKLSNRATQGAYPPGSVFKIFMAFAALSEKIVGPHDKINCPGFYMFAGRPYRCHKKSGHGPVDLHDALAQSCDVYFYSVGQRLGVDKIHEYATKFGLGLPTGLDLVEENKGIIPSTEWKRQYFKKPEDQKWYPGETLSVAIGQGAVTTTPLQIARALAAFVNGGKVLRPFLVKKIFSTDGNFSDDSFAGEVVSESNLDPKIVSLVNDGLIGVVNDPRGTGHRAQLPSGLGITVGGKTGTAQVISLDYGGKSEHLQDHAWFAGYAPATDPKIVVVALVENGGHGGVAAAPLVRQVMESFFVKREFGPLTREEAMRESVSVEGDDVD